MARTRSQLRKQYMRDPKHPLQGTKTYRDTSPAAAVKLDFETDLGSGGEKRAALAGTIKNIDATNDLVFNLNPIADGSESAQAADFSDGAEVTLAAGEAFDFGKGSHPEIMLGIYISSTNADYNIVVSGG